MSVASFEMLERLRRPGWREQVELVEHQPVRQRVAAKDITRLDGLGRTVVAVPKGTVPSSWVALTAAEQASLVEPPRPPPDGWLEPGHAGFTPTNTVVGRWTIERAA